MYEWEDSNGVQHVTAWSKEVRNAMLRGGAEYQVQRVLDRAGTNWNKNFLLSADAGRQSIRQTAIAGVQSDLMDAKDWGRRCMLQLQEAENCSISYEHVDTAIKHVTSTPVGLHSPGSSPSFL